MRNENKLKLELGYFYMSPNNLFLAILVMMLLKSPWLNLGMLYQCTSDEPLFPCFSCYKIIFLCFQTLRKGDCMS